jgi:ELWxxDGT repeat protein
VVPVEAAGGLYFVVNERSHGSELWRTDGTEAGTFRVADLNPGAGSAFSAGDQVVSTGKSLFFVADDGQKGREPWGLPFAPIRCPPSVFIEATNPSADLASYPAATPTPGVATLPPVSYSHASGSAFPFGSTVVTATASDPAWPASGCTFTVTVGDSTPPQLQCLGEVWVEAASSQGAVVTYPPAMATDLISTPTITYEPPSGSVLHLGANGVTLTATDAAGNASSCTFDVEVVDTTPPRIQCPGDRVVEATSFPTTQVSYPPATVSDAVGSTSGPYYSVLSDSPFPLGETKVTVSASDWRGNGGSCSFTVSVRDTQPPRIQCPADVTIQAATSQGTHIYLREPAQGTDNLAPPVVSYTPDMTQLYPVGTREVTAIATDVGGNTASCTFNVTVEPPATPDAPASCGCQPDSPGGVSPWWLLTLVAFVHQRVLSRSRARSG